MSISNILPNGSKLQNRYEIVELLSNHGAFGVTYRAKDTQLPWQPPCVVKQLKQRIPDAERLFQRESESLWELDLHKQIPRLLAYFEEKGEFYLVQEFVDGHDLSCEICDGKSLSEEETVVLLRGILEILDFIHQSNIIHRDLKPSNIMRRHSDGKLVIIDFGAVKKIDKSYLDGNSATVCIGTPGYMPIEQNLGRPTFASDIYAVGIIGIFALIKIHPKNLRDCETKEFLWQHQVNITENLANILNKMVQHNCNQRYKDAGEALEAINQIKTSKRESNISVPIDPVVINPRWIDTLWGRFREWWEYG